MILRDHDIKELGDSLIVNGYRQECVEAISYRVTIKAIIHGNNEKLKYELQPLDTVYVKTNEVIKLPCNMAARVVERNTIMRKGLAVSGPHYQPGHKTNMFLRVENLSNEPYTLESGTNPEEAIAQIEFEKLEGDVDKPYDGKYQDEDKFQGAYSLGITDSIKELIKSKEKLEGDYNHLKDEHKLLQDNYEKLKESYDNIGNKIYAELLTLMGIFVAIFSLIVVNTSGLGKLINNNIWNILIINASLGLALTGVIGLIMPVTGKIKKESVIAVVISGLFFVGLIIIAA